MKNIKIIDLGKIDIFEGIKKQEECFNSILVKRKFNEEINNYILLLEHETVYTKGKGYNVNDFIDEEKNRVINVNRNGGLTCHNLGQIVIYYIFDLTTIELNNRKFSDIILSNIKSILKEIGLDSYIDNENYGLWVDDKKICSIGLNINKRITSFGISLNICNDLSVFDIISPCGITDKKMTSISKELDKDIKFDEIKNIIKNKIIKLLL